MEYLEESDDIWQNGGFGPFLDDVTMERDLTKMRDMVDNWEAANRAVARIWGNTYYCSFPRTRRLHVSSSRTPGWVFPHC